MEGEQTIKVKIPNQDLAEFTHFPPNEAAALGWAQALPVARTNVIVGLLISALNDLNRVKLNPEVRFKVMEALRPKLDIALSSLTKRFLNQPLIMPHEPLRMAELGNTLCTLTSSAYAIVAVNAIQQHEGLREINPARLACQAIQRSLVYGGRRVLQSFQLYRPLEIRAWQSLHQLYALAESQQLANLPVPEPLTGGDTITKTYLQAMILGCCKPNNLRQTDLSALYLSLQEWSGLVSLHSSENAEGLFLVNLDSDQPPLYSSLNRNNATQHHRYIETGTLVEHLRVIRREAGNAGVDLDTHTNLSKSMLDHLIASLGSTSLRNFKRTPSDSKLQVCIGLGSMHFHIAGGRTFEELLGGMRHVTSPLDSIAVNQFMKPTAREDLWKEANPGDYTRETRPGARAAETDLGHQVNVDEQASAARFPIFPVKLTDASPGGYCLDWNVTLPGDIKAGDLVGLRENDSKDWVIAVIRWFSQLENAKTLIGLELLSPRAQAVGATIQKKMAPPPPALRALLLPEIKLVGLPSTLITPRVGFKEQQRVVLQSGQERRAIQLLKQTAATASYTQFEFRDIQELGDLLASDEKVKLGADYDSLWSNI